MPRLNYPQKPLANMPDNHLMPLGKALNFTQIQDHHLDFFLKFVKWLIQIRMIAETSEETTKNTYQRRLYCFVATKAIIKQDANSLALL